MEKTTKKPSSRRRGKTAGQQMVEKLEKNLENLPDKKDIEAQPVKKASYTTEGDDVYVTIEIPNYSQANGEKLSTPFRQYFNKKEWPGVLVNLPKQGYVFRAVHNLPEGCKPPTITEERR